MSFLEKVDAYFPLQDLTLSAEDDNVNHNDDDNDVAAFEDSFQHTSWLNKNNDGDGIQFLPGDIKGLETKLNYLLAKYQAGKVVTHSKPNCIDSRQALTKEKDIEKRIQGD